MERHTAAWWSERVDELASGGDSRGISRRHGVKERTLLWWRSELRKRGFRPLRLLPVSVAASPHTISVLDGLEIVVEVGIARISVRGAVSAGHLGALVSAVRAC